jgi:hypothetical protein
MGTASAIERAAILGIFAIPSALLCTYLPTPPYLTIWQTPLPPALWFGVVLCFGTALWISRSPFDLLAVLLTSFAAWVSAFQTTIRVHDSIVFQIHRAPPPEIPTPLNYILGISGAIGGFIGSAIVVFGISVVIRSFRTFDAWAKTILLGTIAGSLLELEIDPTENGLLIHIGSILPLFLIWQTSVAASIAFSLKPDLTYAPLHDRSAPI